MDSFLREKKRKLLDYWKRSNIITDKRLLEAFEMVPRENFISENDRARAYSDHPLPIPCRQTISQPTTVMLMSQALEIQEGMKILEIGTGSGYQAAILSVMAGTAGKVVSIEYYEKLAGSARAKLSESGYSSVTVLHADGGPGYEGEAPYDRIIVTCACPEVPPPLIEQLKTGGILVLPVKKPLYDDMLVIRKTPAGIEKNSLGSFIFVPLRGKYG